MDMIERIFAIGYVSEIGNALTYHFWHTTEGETEGR